MNRLFEKKKISIVIFPMLVVFCMDVILWISLYRTKSVYSVKTISFSGVFTVIWCVFFFFEQTKKEKNNGIMYVESNMLCIIFFSILLAAYYCTMIWRSGYLSLNPIGAINNGKQHLDTLFHSAIAESYKYSFMPSALINDCNGLKYHTFSHFLMSGISALNDIPCFICYNYFYPVVFLPIYLFAQFAAVCYVRNYFNSSFMGVGQLIVIFFYNVGFLNLEAKYGIYVFHFIGSESFNIALSIMFFYVMMAFAVIRIEKNKKIKKYLSLLLMAILLFFMFWSKISVGLVMLSVTMYYIFKMGLKKIKWWLCNFSFLIVFVFYYFFFQNDHYISSSVSTESFRFLAFNDYCVNRLGIFGYWLFVSIMSIIYVFLVVQTEHIKPKDFLTEKTIWIDITIVGSIFAFLPGALIDIPGASASYFSEIIMPISMILLCSRDFVDINRDINIPLRQIVNAIIFIWCVASFLDKFPGRPLYEVTENSSTMDGLYGELINIRNEAEDDRQNYTIYLESDAKSIDVFQEDNYIGLREAYVYPAITGISVINATYLHDDKYYTFLDNEVKEKVYCSTRTNHDKLDYEEAKIRAKSLGKKFIIHVFRDDYIIEKL